MPNRIIKESIHTSDDVNAMSDFEFRLWVSLLVYVDDYGRGDARPAIIKGACFPLRERLTTKDIEAALRNLAGIGCVSLYEVGGKPYLYFPRWASHQNIRNKQSKFPAPPDCEQLQANEINCKQLQANVPVIQSNPNPNPNPNPKDDDNAPAREAVISAFVQKINPQPSTVCLSELVGFSEQLGAELCVKAIDIAVDANAANWNYIKAILADWQRKGFRTVADVDRAEAQRSRDKSGGKGWDFRELARNG